MREIPLSEWGSSQAMPILEVSEDNVEVTTNAN